MEMVHQRKQGPGSKGQGPSRGFTWADLGADNARVSILFVMQLQVVRQTDSLCAIKCTSASALAPHT